MHQPSRGATGPALEDATPALLRLLLMLALLAGVLPLFACAIVFRFFRATSVLLLFVAALAMLAAPFVLGWRPVRSHEPPAGAAWWAGWAGAGALGYLALALASQSFRPDLIARALANIVGLPPLAWAVALAAGVAALGATAYRLRRAAAGERALAGAMALGFVMVAAVAAVLALRPPE